MQPHINVPGDDNGTIIISSSTSPLIYITISVDLERALYATDHPLYKAKAKIFLSDVEPWSLGESGHWCDHEPCKSMFPSPLQ